MANEINKEAAEAKFGMVLRDTITGFSGTCTGVCYYISGCDQLLLTPQVDEKGEFRSGHWFDDERLIEAETGKPLARTSRKGGPEHSPAAK